MPNPNPLAAMDPVLGGEPVFTDTEGNWYIRQHGDPRAWAPPADIVEALKDYAANRHQHGGFVMALLEGNLVRAVQNADGTNIHFIPALVAWMWANLEPGNCWGSKAVVAEYLAGAAE